MSRTQIIPGRGHGEALTLRCRVPVIHPLLLNSESLLPCPVWYKFFFLERSLEREGALFLVLICFAAFLFQWWGAGVWTLDGAHPSECQWPSTGVSTKSFMYSNAPTGTFFDPFVGAPGSFPESFATSSPLLKSSQWLSGNSSWCPAKFPARSSTHLDDSLTASWWVSCPPTSPCW